jgi:hypothetical protein
MTARCSDCRWFEGRRGALERAIAGLATLSSADASVTAGDGLCTRHDVVAAPSGGCAAYEARVSA